MVSTTIYILAIAIVGIDRSYDVVISLGLGLLAGMAIEWIVRRTALTMGRK